MPAIQWTPEIIATYASVIVASALLGYLIAALRHGTRISRLGVELEQAQRLQADTAALQLDLQSQLKTADVHRQQLQVVEGTLQATLKAETESSARSLAGLLERLQQAELLLKQERNTAEQKQNALHTQLNDLQSQHTKLMTEQKEREASHARELETFEKQKASLSEQFKLLSNEILEAKSKSLQESNRQSLSAVISPFQQSIDTFKKEVQDIHHRETSQQGELRKELEQLKELNQKITMEAHELSTALRGQKKLQGNWGELVLENVLDRSGLQLDRDYKREVSITNEGGRQRPDVIVYLPQDKHLIIDSKVSLNAYVRFVNSEDEAERATALKEHVQAIGNRIKELSDREYSRLPGLKTPDMVFMFIPIESAFVEALKADEQLFQNAIENNVLVATPTTLLTSLNIVRQLWRFEDQNKHTAALASKADGVFNKLNTFLDSFNKIKKGLEAATDAYSKAEGQLVSGRGNLVKQVSDFKKLAPAIKGELPAYFVEKAVLEIDFVAPQQPAADDHGTGDIGSDDSLDDTSEQSQNTK
jgi:DNA recombination protein RmuC